MSPSMHVAIDLAIDDVGRDKIYIIIANCACGCGCVYIHVPCTDLWCAHVWLQLLAHNTRVHQRAQMCTQWLSLAQTMLHYNSFCEKCSFLSFFNHTPNLVTDMHNAVVQWIPLCTVRMSHMSLLCPVLHVLCMCVWCVTVCYV